MKTQPPEGNNQAVATKASSARKRAAESPLHAPGDRGAVGGHRKTATAGHEAMKKTKRPGRKEESKGRDSNTKESAQKSKSIKSMALGQGNGVKEDNLEFASSGENKTLEERNNWNEIVLSLQKLYAESSQNWETMQAIGEFMSGFNKLMLLLAKPNPQLVTSSLLTLLTTGSMIPEILLSLVSDYPDIAKPIVERCMTWPSLWHPTDVGRKRVHEQINQLNIGKALLLEHETADRSDAPITEVVMFIHVILDEIRAPSMVKLHEPTIKLNNAIVSILNYYDE